jgi:hypothetical protein
MSWGSDDGTGTDVLMCSPFGAKMLVVRNLRGAPCTDPPSPPKGHSQDSRPEHDSYNDILGCVKGEVKLFLMPPQAVTLSSEITSAVHACGRVDRTKISLDRIREMMQDDTWIVE